MTLVVMEDGPASAVLWAEIAANYLGEAVDELTAREGCAVADIGRWPNETDQKYRYEDVIGEWAKKMSFAGVVWTSLPPGFQKQRGTVPTIEQILSYLGRLEGDALAPAKEYVQKAPSQIITPYRQTLEAFLSSQGLPG